MMKTKKWMWGLGILVIFVSCEKEYSEENAGTPDALIVGLDCRINKIVYTDTATKSGIGSLEAAINSLDFVTKITKYDSLSSTIEFISTPTYISDTIYINPDEYFIADINRRITKLHGLLDPTDPFSLQFDVFYVYNGTGYLVRKNYFLSISPTFLYYQVNYTYNLGNLTHMSGTDQLSGDLIVDADVGYYNNIVPRRYLYIFPDEKGYPYFNQFF